MQDPSEPWFKCLHPEYKSFIPPAALRRMSPVIRMGLTAALTCLEDADVKQPDAILVGSGLGCVQDTVKFLRQVEEQREELLNPTAFIQSTHNTVAGQIALLLKCHAPNLTFSQKHFSFESALLDALMISSEDPGKQILVGGVDETTPESHRLMTLQGCIKVNPGEDLLKSQSPGAVAGEGAAFFLLSGRKEGSVARVGGLETLSGPMDSKVMDNAVTRFLDHRGLTPGDVDLLISGRSGDGHLQETWDRLEKPFADSTLMAYKHLVGEYDSASSFAFFLGLKALSGNPIPRFYLIRETGLNPSRILIMNTARDRSLSLMLMTHS
jgi:3-oxoacyl-(acyl-carrier-protein) synthase